jgi:hypothetical protein
LDGFFNGIDNVTVTGGSGSFTVTFGGTQSTTNMQQRTFYIATKIVSKQLTSSHGKAGLGPTLNFIKSFAM